MNGLTKLVGILGWPVSHSKSPAMHNAAFAYLKLNWAYVPLPVATTTDLKKAVEGLKACGFAGVNVTVPYKESIIPFLDSISPSAREIGAVNTLVINEFGNVHGENTDAPGFIAHLTAEGIDVSSHRVAIIGAGGAARAVVYALRKAGAQNIVVINRNKDRIHALPDAQALVALEWNENSFTYACNHATLLIQATSLGLNDNDSLPFPESLHFSKHQIVYDTIYRKTRLLKKAEKDGARAISGDGMLLWQGALAFELWTNVKAPIDIMKKEVNYA